jgi:transposase-like protein
MAKRAKWRRHTVEFKRQVVERMKTCENIEALARELKLERKLLYTWKYQFEGRPEPRHANLGTTSEDRKDVPALRGGRKVANAHVFDHALA